MFKLPDLPFQKNDLAPYMSEDTLSFHHGKHHKTYVDNLNNFTKDTDWAEMDLEEVILKSHGKSEHVAIFNNSAQIWNHTFFWNCLKKGGGGSPKGHLLERIEKDFGSLDAFKEQFKKAALTQFGSGWAWLVEDNGVLKVEKTPNAETPLTNGQKPLLTIDVWEHAYYIDFQNRRPDFVDTFFNNLVNWEFVESNL